MFSDILLVLILLWVFFVIYGEMFRGSVEMGLLLRQVARNNRMDGIIFIEAGTSIFYLDVPQRRKSALVFFSQLEGARR